MSFLSNALRRCGKLSKTRVPGVASGPMRSPTARGLTSYPHLSGIPKHNQALPMKAKVTTSTDQLKRHFNVTRVRSWHMFCGGAQNRVKSWPFVIRQQADSRWAATSGYGSFRDVPQLTKLKAQGV